MFLFGMVLYFKCFINCWFLVIQVEFLKSWLPMFLTNHSSNFQFQCPDNLLFWEIEPVKVSLLKLKIIKLIKNCNTNLPTLLLIRIVREVLCHDLVIRRAIFPCSRPPRRLLHTYYLLEFMRGQKIKLIHTFSNSKSHE